MFIDLFSEFCEEGGFSLLSNKDEPIFRGYVLPYQHGFLIILCRLLQLKRLRSDLLNSKFGSQKSALL